jgi:hypothetical protein
VRAVRLRPSPDPVPSAPMNLEWAVAGLVIWLISVGTCLVCEAAPEFIDLGYAEHQSARGTTERPQ